MPSTRRFCCARAPKAPGRSTRPPRSRGCFSGSPASRVTTLRLRGDPDQPDGAGTECDAVGAVDGAERGAGPQVRRGAAAADAGRREVHADRLAGSPTRVEQADDDVAVGLTLAEHLLVAVVDDAAGVDR